MGDSADMSGGDNSAAEVVLEGDAPAEQEPEALPEEDPNQELQDNPAEVSGGQLSEEAVESHVEEEPVSEAASADSPVASDGPRAEPEEQHYEPSEHSDVAVIPAVQKPEMREFGTMTPPVKLMAPRPDHGPPPVVDTGDRKPPPPPQYILVAPPLIKIREPTEEEWQVEDLLVDLVQWAVDDRHRQLAKQSLVRHSYSGQNTALNNKHQVKLQTMRKAHLDQQKKKIEQEAKDALRRSVKISEKDLGDLAELENTDAIRSIRAPVLQVEEEAKEALARSLRAGRLKAARTQAKLEEAMQQRSAEREAERFHLRTKEANEVVSSILRKIIARAVKIAEAGPSSAENSTQHPTTANNEKLASVQDIYTRPFFVNDKRMVSARRKLLVTTIDMDATSPEKTEEEPDYNPDANLHQSRLRSTGGWDNTVETPLKPVNKAQSLLMENPVPPTIPRRQVKIVAERRTVSARASSTQRRASSTDRPMTGAPPLGAHESAEVEGVGVQGEMPNPSNPFGPWGEPSQTDLAGGDLAMVIAKEYHDQYDVDYTAEAAARRRRAVLSASPAVWGEPPKPPPLPPVPQYFDMDYQPLWMGTVSSCSSWWASLCQLLAATQERSIVMSSFPDAVFIQDGFLTGWYAVDSSRGFCQMPMLDVVPDVVLKRFRSCQAKARKIVANTFQCETSQRKGSRESDRYCKIPIAIAYYQDAKMQKTIAKPITFKQLKTILSEVYPAAEQMLQQPGMDAATEGLPFMIRPFVAFDPARRTRYLTELKLQPGLEGCKPEFRSLSYRWKTALEMAEAEGARDSPEPADDSPEPVTMSFRNRVEQSEEDSAVEDVLQELIADADAYISGFEEVHDVGMDVTGGSVSAWHKGLHNKERPRKGGLKIKSGIRKDLFEATRAVVEQLLIVHDLSCAGISAEWGTDLRGNLQLIAVHHLQWHDAPAHHLAGVVAALHMTVPEGARPSFPGKAPAKPTWNTNTTKAKTFHAGSSSRPDRAEPPPPSVHMPRELEEQIRKETDPKPASGKKQRKYVTHQDDEMMDHNEPMAPPYSAISIPYVRGDLMDEDLQECLLALAASKNGDVHPSTFGLAPTGQELLPAEIQIPAVVEAATNRAPEDLQWSPQPYYDWRGHRMTSADSAVSDQPSNHAPSYLSDAPQEYESIPEDSDMTSRNEIVTRQTSPPVGRPRVGSPLRYSSPDRSLDDFEGATPDHHLGGPGGWLFMKASSSHVRGASPPPRAVTNRVVPNHQPDKPSKNRFANVGKLEKTAAGGKAKNNSKHGTKTGAASQGNKPPRSHRPKERDSAAASNHSSVGGAGSRVSPRVNSAPVRRQSQGSNDGVPRNSHQRPGSGVIPAQQSKNAVERLELHLNAMEEALQAGQSRADILVQQRGHHARGAQQRAGSAQSRHSQLPDALPALSYETPAPAWAMEREPNLTAEAWTPSPSSHAAYYYEQRRGSREDVDTGASAMHHHSRAAVSKPDHLLNLDIAMIPSPAAQMHYDQGMTNVRPQYGRGNSSLHAPVHMPAASHALGYSRPGYA